MFKHFPMSVVNDIAPIITVRFKQRSDPWMDSEILLAIRDRDNALHNFKKLKSPESLLGSFEQKGDY